MSVGVVFVSTGGSKMLRALRSFRRSEPQLPVHILFNTSSNSWARDCGTFPPECFLEQPSVAVRCITNGNGAFINGSFNAAVRWLGDIGFTHACVFHDDTVFSPLAEHRFHLSEWFTQIESDPALLAASGLTLAAMEALVHPPVASPGCWQRSPEWWDTIDLESESVWRILCPGGRPAMYFGSPGAGEGVSLGEWFVKYFVTERLVSLARLGPPAFIVPVRVWEALGGFSETNGIFYDMEYPILAAMRGFGVVKAVPSVPCIHLHNQSTGFGDPAVGLWGRDLQSFIDFYGREPGAIAQEHGY